jgi:hypothetical protein
VIAPEPDRNVPVARPVSFPTGSVEHVAEDARAQLRPVLPRRELDELMDDVLFAPRCLSYYARDLGSCWLEDANEQLREEVRRSGFLIRPDGTSQNFGRIRVPGRFDFVLRDRPSADAPTTVTGLKPLAPRRSGRRRAGAHRKAA